MIAESQIDKGAHIGPFAHLRPGCHIGEDAHIGNFVEVKKTRLGKGSKANHLTYLGDAEIGSGVNIGAGTITCNYDGVAKHKTVIGDKVFIGSDSALVAPIVIGEGAYIGAGSTITKDVPADALAVARGSPGHERRLGEESSRAARGAQVGIQRTENRGRGLTGIRRPGECCRASQPARRAAASWPSARCAARQTGSC